jgi:predicted DNA-binding antitoxin AbrB/MazE fold protein
MPITVDAVYENGVLKPSQPLALQEHEEVRLTIQPKANWVQETCGLIPWKGDRAALERFSRDPGLDPQEGP